MSYTVTIFSLVTVGTVAQFDAQSISYINNCKFPGVEGDFRPLGYQELQMRIY